ncbi:MAG: GTP 3',8-cyclase MoaA [Halanaerobium sp.]
MKELRDKFGRKINYLRISITDRCNLRCKYCMPEDGVELKKHSEILSFEDIIKIVKVGQELGVEKIRLTGGEPLVRLGVDDLIGSLAELKIKDISMTTNGVLLAEKAEKLKNAGLNRVNISLDTLKKDRFEEITRRDYFDKVLTGIESALKFNLKPVKINTVVMNGFNDDEIFDFVELSRSKNIHVRFIEYMPLGGEADEENFMSSEETKKLIESHYKLVTAVTKGNGPAKYFKVPGAAGTIGFISALSEHFCSECNRMRLTADGRFKPCLASNKEVEIAKTMTEKDIYQAYQKALEIKPSAHHLNFADNDKHDRKMSQIGG